MNGSLSHLVLAGDTDDLDPGIRLAPGMRVTLTSPGLYYDHEQGHFTQPQLTETTWVVPRDGQGWTNRDIVIFGHLLAIADLRFAKGDDQPSNKPGDLPSPGDFLQALTLQYPDVWSGAADPKQKANAALHQLSKLQFTFSQSAIPDLCDVCLPAINRLYCRTAEEKDDDGFQNYLARRAVKASAVAAMYRDLDTLVERKRSLQWSAPLPRIFREETSPGSGKWVVTGLIVETAPVEGKATVAEDFDKRATASQSGFVWPHKTIVDDYRNAVNADQTLQVVQSVELEVAVRIDGIRRYVPVWYTIADLQRDCGSRIRRITRCVSSEVRSDIEKLFPKHLRLRPPKSGSHAGPDTNPVSAPGWITLVFRSCSSPHALHVLWRADEIAIKKAMLVGHDDRIDTVSVER